MTDSLRQTGRSHKQILEALTRLETECRVIYLVTGAPEYYIAIACQVLWANKAKYRVSKNNNIAVITDNDHVLWIKKYEGSMDEWLRGIPESQIIEDHHLVEMRRGVPILHRRDL